MSSRQPNTRHPEEMDMAEATVGIATRPAPVAIPIREWWPWALFAGVVMFLFVYMVGWDQGATSLFSGHYVHEFLHDARHLLGSPCH